MSLLLSAVLVLSAGLMVAAKVDLPPEMVEMLNTLQQTCEQETAVDIGKVYLFILKLMDQILMVS